MKKLTLVPLFVVIALTLLFLTSCDRNSFADNILGPEEITDEDFIGSDGSYYRLEAGAIPTKQNPENGDKVWIVAGNGFFQDPQNQNAPIRLYPNDDSKKILLGTISSSTPFSSMETKVLMRPLAENENSINRVRFALEKSNGDFEMLWNVPLLKKYDASGNVIASYECSRMLLSQSSNNHFPTNRPKTFIPCNTFGINYSGDFFTLGILESEFVTKTVWFDGVSAYTADGTNLVSLTDDQIPDFSEPCSSDMDCKIKWSGSQFQRENMDWNQSLDRWEATIKLHPDQVFNLTIFALNDPGTPKVFGINVENCELMNNYEFYEEFLVTAKTVSGIVQNIEPVDLRGVWAGIGPQK
ncbi:MAG: hypothetical protein PHH83_01410 [Patescibacteria group bacterium]|nr:hypothetical protein [Patescibacteria group bacterium]